MDFLERDLEQIIFETENKYLNERGLGIYGKKFRQINIGNYGRLDIATIHWECNNIKITVYELKKGVIDMNTLAQALSYCKGISRYISKRGIFNGINIEYDIVLIGNDIAYNKGFSYIQDFFENISLVTYDYKYDGIFFNNEYDYKLKNEGF